MQKYLGNVTAAAQYLGISRHALYKLLKRGRVRPECFRQEGGAVATPAGVSTRVTPAKSGAENSSGNLVANQGPPTFEAVETQASEPPSPPSKRQPAPSMIRMDPAHIRRLEEAGWELSPRLRRTVTKEVALEMFYAEEFEAWLRRILASDRKREE